MAALAVLPATSTGAATDAASPREILEELRHSLETRRVVGDLVRFEGTMLAGYSVEAGDPGGPIVRPLDVGTGDSPGAHAVPSREYLLAGFPVAGLLRSDPLYGLEPCAARPIAGRATRCVRVLPKDEHRPGYTLWVDVAAGVLLGATVHDPGGAPLEFMQYTRIRVEEQPPVPEHARGPEVVSPEAGTLPRWLPPGFVPVAAGRNGVGRVMHFSDGVTGFSVFVTPLENPSAGTGESVRGASVVVDRMVRGAAGRDHLVTIAGEIPLPTARRILLGIRVVP
jgi:hypothetical protein